MAHRYERATDHVIELSCRHELLDRESADRDHELRLQNLQLTVEPDRAPRNLFRRWHAIAAAGLLAGKAAADGRHVNACAKLRFTEARRFVEPSEERLAGRPCKRPAECGLAVAGGLTDEKDFADHRTAGNN